MRALDSSARPRWHVGDLLETGIAAGLHRSGGETHGRAGMDPDEESRVLGQFLQGQGQRITVGEGPLPEEVHRTPVKELDIDDLGLEVAGGSGSGASIGPEIGGELVFRLDHHHGEQEIGEQQEGAIDHARHVEGESLISSSIDLGLDAHGTLRSGSAA